MDAKKKDTETPSAKTKGRPDIGPTDAATKGNVSSKPAAKNESGVKANATAGDTPGKKDEPDSKSGEVTPDPAPTHVATSVEDEKYLLRARIYACLLALPQPYLATGAVRLLDEVTATISDLEGNVRDVAMIVLPQICKLHPTAITNGNFSQKLSEGINAVYGLQVETKNNEKAMQAEASALLDRATGVAIAGAPLQADATDGDLPPEVRDAVSLLKKSTAGRVPV